MGNQAVIKLFLVLLVSTAYIFSFSHFGALAYEYSTRNAINSNHQVTIKESTMMLSEGQQEIEKFVNKRIEIRAKSQFSFLRFIQEENLENMSPLSLNKMATLIYEVVLPTNFSINERHISDRPPDYASLGYEAMIDSNQDFDLIFTNPNEYSYFIDFESLNRVMRVSLSGPEFLHTYEIAIEDKKSLKPTVSIQNSSQLMPSEVEVKREGQTGTSIHVFRESYDEEGSLLQKELISEDIYPPSNRVEIHGIASDDGNSSDEQSRSYTGNIDDDKNEQNTLTTDKNVESDLWGIPNERLKQ